MGIVVEFCGLPGVGKSTIARAVVAQLRLAGIPAAEVMAPIGPSASSVERLTRKAGIILRSAGRTDTWRLATRIGARSAQMDPRDRIARPANLIVVRSVLARARSRPGVQVFDQGPVQEWWSAALRGDSEKVLAWAAADGVTGADLVVRVDVPLDAVLDRLNRRAGTQSRLEAPRTTTARVELERGEALLDALCSQLVHSHGTQRPRLIRVDGIDSAAGEIVGEAIAELR